MRKKSIRLCYKSKSMIIYMYSFDSKGKNNIDDEKEEELVKYTLIPSITINERIKELMKS